MYASLGLIGITGLMIGGLYYFGVKEGLVLKAILLLHEITFWISVNLMGCILLAQSIIGYRKMVSGVPWFRY
jgi:hypothetical protein